MNLVQRISLFNRNRKWRTFLDEIQPTPQTTVLDVGFANREVSPTANYIERHYPWPENLTALGLDEPTEFRRRYPKVKAVRYDGVDFPFADQTFDVVWSNAVIEHVGGFDRQVHFLKEMLRVGRRVFFSTPNRGFPMELHTRMPFVHWLPKPACDRILQRIGKGFATGDYMHLLYKSDLRRILAQAGASHARFHANRILGLAMDYVVVCRAP
jgi:SAM-dependent methyltransferase